MIRLENVTYKYPYQNKEAVKNINLSVKSGEVVVCTGVSGCGKTTLIRLINGLCPHYYKGELSGDVFICNENTKEKTIGELSSYTGSLFQDPEQQFFALNVDDELAFALECKGLDADTIKKEINKTAHEFKIQHILSSSVNDLSEGQKQKVGLAGIILQKAKVIILDEPTANLDVESTDELAEKIKYLKLQGYAILIVDHRLYWTKDIADRFIVMSKGEIVKEGDFSILLNNEFRKIYGLRDIEITDNRSTLADYKNSSKNIINIENLSFNYKGKENIFNNASFTVPFGVTAILGENGAGKTTLAKLLTGINKNITGKITINNKEIDKKILVKTASLVLQNADFQLYMKSTYDEIYMSVDVSHNNITEDEKKEITNNLLNQFDLYHLKERHPQSLSGGEKQRLVIACAVAKEPSIIILDEPTSGLDGRNMMRITNILQNLANKGVAVVVITHDLELINNICQYAIRLPFSDSLKQQAV